MLTLCFDRSGNLRQTLGGGRTRNSCELRDVDSRRPESGIGLPIGQADCCKGRTEECRIAQIPRTPRSMPWTAEAQRLGDGYRSAPPKLETEHRALRNFMLRGRVVS